MGNIILASQSPRRRALLEQMGLHDFVIHPAQGEEHMEAHLAPGPLAESLALAKAREVAAAAGPEDIVIAADTIVTLEHQVLGKPHSRQEAVSMLATLSGRRHVVYTGLAVMQGAQCVSCYEGTGVQFRPLTAEEIAAYVDTGEPMDKAGAYGIQGRGALLITGIEGDYFNVMGLPICRLGQILKGFGVVTL